MIQYSRKVLQAIAFLFRPYNDIDIYVEDETCRNMWESILSRALGKKVRLVRIFPLQGKTEVLKECEKNQGQSTRPTLYIIDGDLDFVVGNKMPKLKHLYRLNAYTVENLLFSKTALIEVGFDCKTELPRDKVEEMLAFGKILRELVRKLRPLFIIYGVAFVLDPDLKTTSYNVMKLCVQKNGKHELSSLKIRERISLITEQLKRNHMNKSIADTKRKIASRVPVPETEAHLYISGKTYLIPWLHLYLRQKFGFDGSMNQLKTRLARHYDIGMEPGLKKALNKALR